MGPDQIATLAARPESVMDWEDLLLRLEIVPRVVRNTVDDLVNDTLGARLLAEATDRERRVGDWLERAAGLVRDGPPVEGDGESMSPADLARRFASLRARTFAMVQRRGLEVWDWEAPLDGAVVVIDDLEGVVYLRLKGSCDGCPSSAITARHAIEGAGGSGDAVLDCCGLSGDQQ